MAESRRSQVAISLFGALLFLLCWRLVGEEDDPATVEAPPAAPPATPKPSRADMPRAVAAADVWDDRLPRPLRAEEYRLGNGLTVWIVPDPSEPVVAARVAVRAGGVDDPPDRLGLAHLVEHLIFQGTDRLGALDWWRERPVLADQRDLTALLASSEDPDERRQLRSLLESLHAEASAYAQPNELIRILDRLGATDVNASTAPEYTSFQATLPPHALAGWAEALAEALARPVFRGFVPEQAVVEAEADLRDTCGLRRTRHELLAAVFGAHPYGRPVGGTAATRAQIDLDAAFAFHERWYRPDNALIVLVGDVDPTEAAATVEAAFAGWRGNGAAPTRAVPRPRTAAPAATVDGPPWYAWPVPEGVPREVLRVLLAAIRNEGGRTFGLEEVQASVTRLARGDTLLVSGKCERTVSHAVCAEALLGAVRHARATVGSPATIRSAARGAWVEELRRLESPAAQADELVATWSRGEPSEQAWGWRSRIRAVPPEALADLGWLALDGFAPAEPVKAPSKDQRPAPPSVSDGATSAFAAALLARVPQPSEAGWREPGMHWTVSADGSVIATPNVRNTLFEAELRWPLGWAIRPGSCAALFAWRRQVVDELRERGVEVQSGECGWDHVSMRVRGPEESAAWAMARVLPSLAELQATDLVHGAAESFKAYYGDPLRTVVPVRGAREGVDEQRARLAALRPRAAYSGRASADQVAGWIRPGAYADLADWPAVTPRALTVQDRAKGRVTAVRIGEPYDPDRESLYALYERWLVGGAGAVFEQVRTRDADAYTIRAEFRRGRWPGDPNLTLVQVSATEDWAGVAHGVGTVLTAPALEPDRWATLRGATAVHLQTEVIPFRRLSEAAWTWTDRGLPTDGRRFAFEALATVDEAEFNLFLAAEAARPIRWEVRGPGAPQADWSGLPR